MEWISNTYVLVNPEEELSKRIVFRHVGWLSEAGYFYSLKNGPAILDPGDFSPVYTQVEFETRRGNG